MSIDQAVILIGLLVAMFVTFISYKNIAPHVIIRLYSQRWLVWVFLGSVFTTGFWFMLVVHTFLD